VYLGTSVTFNDNLSKLPHANEWKLGITIQNARMGGGQTMYIHIWVKTRDQLRPQQKVHLPPRIDLCGDGILKVTVEMGSYDVMVAEPGCVGEKKTEYRADSSHWRGRLCCAGNVDNLKTFRWVMVFGGVNVFDSKADWFIAKHMGHSLTEGVGERIVGPFSNKYTKGFNGSVWEIGLGMIAQRHRKGEEQIEEQVGANNNSPPQKSTRINDMIYAANRRFNTALCSVPLNNSKRKYGPTVEGQATAYIRAPDCDRVSSLDKELNKESAVSFIVDAPIEVAHALFYPGDAIAHYANGDREMAVFGGAFFFTDTGEEFAVLRRCLWDPARNDTE
jgi:hypothetical protein